MGIIIFRDLGKEEHLNFNGMGTIRIMYRMGWLWTTSLKSCPVRFPLNVFCVFFLKLEWNSFHHGFRKLEKI